MSDGGTGDRGAARGSGPIPFWVHQLVEMLLGGLLLLEGARTGQHTAVLVGMGAGLLILALVSDGGLGAWPWIGRRVHRVLDFVFAAAFAITPFLLSLDRVLAIVVIEAVAVGLVWLAWQTNWTRREPYRRRRPAHADEGHPADSVAPAPPSPSPTRAHQLGVALNRVTSEGPRRLGRIVGRAQARNRRPPEDQ